MQAKELILLFFVFFLQFSFSFIPGRRLFSAQLSQIAQSQSSSTQRNAANPDKRTFGSKLFPTLTQEELNAALKEFNITTLDLADDPELLKWAPSKEFFERFGFQNITDRSRKTVSDVKMAFYGTYRRPILPQYKTFVADLMHVLFLQRSDARFQYDPLLAFGICTQYYTIMKGYALSEEVGSMGM
ncbi:hypothetical protein EON64_01325 [archaeon]|nr:MAG: hypothetical protein EON64_01325 [archaeon]